MATTVKIFIASSAEMKEERKDCIVFLNQINKTYKHLDLEPVEWEYDIPHGSYPDFSGVQKAINPLLEECNLYIFIFNSKIGKYTKEEFALATELKKKIFPFFKQGFSPKKDEIAKWTELLDFKESLNERVLYIDYETPKDFQLLLTQNLNLYLSQEFPPSYENKSLSPETTTLLKVLSEKQDEIDELKKANLALPDIGTKNRLALLEQEKNSLTDELNKNKEIQAQQAKEKQELLIRLEPQIVKDNLKQQARIAIKENKYDEAEALLNESAKESISDVASTFYELGKLKKIQLKYKEALDKFELAVKINPEDFDMNMEAGRMLRDLGYNDKAIVHFEKALQTLEHNNSVDKSKLLFLNEGLGKSYFNKGEYDIAIKYCEESLAISRELYGDEHPEIANWYNNLGLVYDSQGGSDKAIKYYEQALAIDKKYYGEEHLQIAIRYNNLGLAYSNKDECDKAINYYEQALDIDKKYYGEDHPDIATSYNNLGGTYYTKGEYDKAINYFEKALAIDKKYYGEEHPDIATRYFNQGAVYYKKADYAKAISYFESALKMHEKFLPPNHPSITNVKEWLTLVQEAPDKTHK
ncbi:MAG: tetratricopeptide repeat protein [Bacteroidia bacterium]